jgi:hypothetical protein
MRPIFASTAVALCLGASPAFAIVPSVNCAGVASLSGNYSGITGFNLELVAGDTVTVSSASNATGQIAGAGVVIFYAGSIITNTSVTATTDADAVMSIGPLVVPPFGSDPATISISCSPDGGGGGGGGGGPIDPDPDPDEVEETRLLLIRTGAQASAGVQAGSIGNGVKSAISAYLASRGALPTRNNLIFSTAGYDPAMPSDVDVWAAYSYRNLSGDVDGHVTDLTFGIQTEIRPDFLIGAMLDIGKLDIQTATDGIEADSIVAGPYFATKLRGGATLSGYLAYGRPDYTYDGGGSADATRLIWGLDLAMEQNWNGWDLTPFVSLSGFREDIGAGGGLAARDVSQVQASVGTRIDFAPSGPIRPYASVALEAQKFDDGTTTSDNLSARLGAGFSMDAGPGTLSVDFDAGEIADGVRDAGLSVRYGYVF